jgi:uncharacterized Rossmann fold enzyme
MRFEEWEPYYLQILDYFAFDRDEDDRAAAVLDGLLDRDDLPALAALCDGTGVTVCGNAPCLGRELHRIRGVVFAADAAADLLCARGILPDAVFTDLDGASDGFFGMSRRGSVMVVHAHGDNIPLLKNWVPRFEGPVVATTQSTPQGRVHNFGGFTDGDRAVFAADALGASAIRIIGFDLDDRDVDPMKRGKLAWARTLLRLIGHDL